ncbi:phenylalanine--tRNA ligase subunit beta [soil metagenome]
MQFPESWLREFCNPPVSTQQLADLLTMAGLEVEEMRKVAPAFDRVVVAEVVDVSRHPNADRLNVCHVNVGSGRLLHIVCGAPNVRVGIKVPCALVGAQLPPSDDSGKPFEIKLGQLRGVESQGMLCSARELKLSDDHGGLLILADDAVVGRDIREQLLLDDTLFTLKLTPNLAHCLSVYGVARELSALTGTPLTQPQFPKANVAHDATLPVTIEAPDLCGRFGGRIIRSVDTKVSTPAWIVDRLQRCGQRPVNALVDISNYVMFELGRPSHIFDLDKIDRQLVVRWGREGETLALLNGTTIKVDPTIGVIADASALESLAGIMGGDATAVSDDTRNVYVEAAFWWPHAVAGRSRRLGFSTDAGHRFERGVDAVTIPEHLERITQLIQSICGGEAGPLDDQIIKLPARPPVALRVARLAKVIGMAVTQEQCAEVFTRLGFEFTQESGLLTVTPPSWRFDLQIEEDLIEEVVRMVGYDKLPSTPPLAPITARSLPEARRGLYEVRHALADLGYQETINFSFVEERWEHELAGNPTPIKLLNPIASQLEVMRSSLLGSLVQVLRFNLARKASRVRVFEVGRVFLRDASQPAGPLAVAGVYQPMRVAGLAYGSAQPVQWGERERALDFFDVKGDIETLLGSTKFSFAAGTHPAMHPGRCASIEMGGKIVGHVGELHPKWRQGYELPQAPMLFEIDADAACVRNIPLLEPIPKQQSSWRDIALVVGEGVTHEALVATINGAQDGLIRSVKLFDVFKPSAPVPGMGEGDRSWAVRLELLDDQATLTDERIESVVRSVLDALGTRLGVRLRG